MKSHHYLDLYVLAILYALILSGLLLYPFDFHSPFHTETSDVRWLLQINGVEISSVSAIRSPSPPNNLYSALTSGNGITVEVWLATKNYQQKGPARIVSYSFNKYLRNFTLGQERHALVMRLRTTKTSLNGTTPELTVKDVFLSDNPQHIVVTYNFSQESVFVNGKRKLQTSILRGRFSNWDPSYHLILGNELTGNRPWNGRLFLVALYNRALSSEEVLQNYQAGKLFMSSSVARDTRIVDGLFALYLFNEKSGDIVRDQSESGLALDLRIPKELQATDQVFLLRPFLNFTFSFKSLKDIIGNIVAFIPFGFLFHIAMSRQYRSSLRVAAFIFVMGMLFSLTIESLQYFLENRFSRMTDVFTNTMGVVLGIATDKFRSYFIKFRIKL